MSIKNLFVGVFCAVVLLAACKKKDVFEPTRLFRPVIAGQLVADSNAILIGWQKIKAAQSYTVRLSRDTFRTIDVTLQVPDTNKVLVTGLRWDQLYQVQVRAEATDSVYNSRFSDLGAIKTPKFPTILNTPSANDVNDEAFRMTWTNSGDPVTSIKVLLAADSSLVREIQLTETDITNQFKIVSGLRGSTGYIGMLYSGTRLRGSDTYVTTAPISGLIVDLRGITDRPSVLQDTLPLVENGSTIILKRGQTYELTTSISLSKSVKVRGGTDLAIPDKPMIIMPSNLNIESNSVIDFIDFEDVYLKGTDATSKYVFNINKASTIKRMSFDNVIAESFRGVVRLQGGVTVTNFSINNSVIFNIGNYGVYNVDNASSKTDHISITNSTIYKADKVISSKQNAVSVKIENVTINEAPIYNNYLIDFSTSSANTISEGVTIKNTIIGVGRANAGATEVKGIRATASVVTTNSFSTADYATTATSGFPIADLNSYNRTSTQLWQDPASGNFTIVDVSFPGAATAGDPRWR